MNTRCTSTDPNIIKATLVRLSSVTHANNMSQRIYLLSVEHQPQGLMISPPATAEQCPPGPYLLFLLNGQGVPSVARIVRVGRPPALPQPRRSELPLAMAEEPPPQSSPRPTPGDSGGRLVTAGVTGLCPYGIGPCWGRANEALWQLPGVAAVASVPDVTTSTALIELPGRGLPPLQQWQTRFDELVAGSYALRGVEVTLTGALIRDAEGVLLLDHEDEHSRIRLARLASTDVVQWDPGSQRPATATAAELHAYAELIASAPGRAVEVTGPLLQHDDGYLLEVRRYEVR